MTTKAWKAKEYLAQSTNIRPEENWQNLGRGKNHCTRLREIRVNGHCILTLCTQWDTVDCQGSHYIV